MKKIKKLIAIMMVAITCFTMFDYSVLSDITGRIGATQSLLKYLEQNGIKYHINY